MNVLLVDNYDSFTHNLKQLLTQLGAHTVVLRNDKIELENLKNYDALVLSPGPGIPDSAGDLKKIIRESHSKLPILGICLGMQAIGEVFGTELKLMERPFHGIATPAFHFNHPLFKNIPCEFMVGRYHSWVLNEEKLSDQLEVISIDAEERIMGIKVKNKHVYGLQFHPESILTGHGLILIKNFLQEARKYAKPTE